MQHAAQVNKAVMTKTFYSNTKHKTCSTKQVIKAIEQALEAEQVKDATVGHWRYAVRLGNIDMRCHAL